MKSMKYSPVPTEANEEFPVTGKFKFPKVTRLKLIGIIFISLTTVILIAVTCLRTRVFSRSPVCDLGQKKTSSVEEESRPSRVKVPHTRRHLPHCIIIGIRKAGTRALLTFLDIHPDIVSAHEEQHFFDDDEFYNEGLEAYRRQMPYTFPDQITLEKTPSYFTEADVPERVYRMNHSIKLLLIVRDPVLRTISDYAQIAESKKKKNKFFDTFENMVIDENNQINRSYKAIRRSMYCKHLANWLDFFKLEQIHIVDGDNLVVNPIEEVQKVETFLGLPHKVTRKHLYFNNTKGFYCIKTDVKEKCLAESKGRKHPDVNPKVLKRLKDFFSPFNEVFFDMIGRRFDWGS